MLPDKHTTKKENASVASMYAVLEATPDMKESDLVVEFNPLQGVQPLNVDMNRVHSVLTSADEAQAIAAEVYKKCMEEASKLEEKKGKVVNEINKTIDLLEKKRKEKVDMAKGDPKTASQHKEDIAKLATQIDDLMGKMERIEKSKKPIEKKEEKKQAKKKNLKESNKEDEWTIASEIIGSQKYYYLSSKDNKTDGKPISRKPNTKLYKTKEEAQAALDKKNLKESNLSIEAEDSKDSNLKPGERYNIRSDKDLLDFLKKINNDSPNQYLSQKIDDLDAIVYGRN